MINKINTTTNDSLPEDQQTPLHVQNFEWLVNFLDRPVAPVLYAPVQMLIAILGTACLSSQ